MKEEFVEFEKFSSLEQAEELASFLTSKGIDFLIEEHKLSYEALLSNGGLNILYILCIKSSQVSQANDIIEKESLKAADIVNNQHYLYAFSDEELLEVLIKSDEWSAFDQTLAKKILEERGKTGMLETLSGLKAKHDEKRFKKDEASATTLLLGYIFAAGMGLLAFLIAIHLISYKKKNERGQLIYGYSDKSRRQGYYIILTALLSMVLWIFFFLYFD